MKDIRDYSPEIADFITSIIPQDGDAYKSLCLEVEEEINEGLSVDEALFNAVLFVASMSDFDDKVKLVRVLTNLKDINYFKILKDTGVSLKELPELLLMFLEEVKFSNQRQKDGFKKIEVPEDFDTTNYFSTKIPKEILYLSRLYYPCDESIDQSLQEELNFEISTHDTIDEAIISFAIELSKAIVRKKIITSEQASDLIIRAENIDYDKIFTKYKTTKEEFFDGLTERISFSPKQGVLYDW